MLCQAAFLFSTYAFPASSPMPLSLNPPTRCDAQGKIECVACSKGEYTASSGSKRCQSCPAQTDGFPEGGSGATTCRCKMGTYYDQAQNHSLLSDGSPGCTVCATVVKKTKTMTPVLKCEGGLNANAVANEGYFVISKACTVKGEDKTCVTSYLCHEGLCLGPPVATNASNSAQTLGQEETRRALQDNTSIGIVETFGVRRTPGRFWREELAHFDCAVCAPRGSTTTAWLDTTGFTAPRATRD